MATEEAVVKVMRYMAAAWQRTQISEQTVAVYVMHMMRTQLAADVLLLSAMNLVDTLVFFPSVAEWRGEAARIQEARDGWYFTANYRLHGHELPEELTLPAGMAADVLGYTPAELMSGGLR